jgi:pyridinium-3,5-bisthiocarboxylic acid mononucleotide nickel chelatase
MKALFFDPSAGASGDMIMASLLDLGADFDAVRQAVESVGCRLEVSRKEKSHIMATKARVISDKRFQSLSDAISIMQGSSLHGIALKNALSALNTLAEAESRVHGVAKEQSRFHEIGALDALADIAGACAARQSLAVERVFSRPVCVGGGFVESEHGLLPIPGPATLEIMRSHSIPWKGGPVDEELLTPTGAALLATLVDEFVSVFPLILAKNVGYGAGSRELKLPNVLRGILAEPIPEQERSSREDQEIHGDRVVQLETNVDDVTGEVLGYLIELLMAAGALDVSVLPAMMKKGRSGNVIRAIVKHEDIELLARIIVRETGSLGVRVFPSLHRFVAEREQRSVQVVILGHIYHANVKISRVDGDLLNIKAEFEDCQRIAKDIGLPLRNVIKIVEEEGRRAADQ